MSVTESESRAAYGPSLKRDLRQADVRCPAGLEMGGRAVLCRIETTLIDVAEQGTSLMAYCCGHYETCSTWRSDRTPAE